MFYHIFELSLVKSGTNNYLKWRDYVGPGSVPNNPFGYAYFVPAYGAGYSYVVTGKNLLYSFNSTGGLLWTFTSGKSVNSYYYTFRSSPVVGNDGTIYLTANSASNFYSNMATVYAVNSAGKTKWQYNVGTNAFYNPFGSFGGDFVLASPAVASDGTVYVGVVHAPTSYSDLRINASLHSINSLGARKWTVTPCLRTDLYPIDLSPVIGPDGTVYVAPHCLSAISSSGKIKWNYSNGNKFLPLVTVAPSDVSVVYVSQEDGQIFALRAADGTVKWTVNTGSQINSSPVVHQDGTLFVGSAVNNLLLAYSPTGALKWIFKTDSPIHAPLTLDLSGLVYLSSDNGTIYALTSAGLQRWAYATGDSTGIGLAVTADGGTVFAQSGSLAFFGEYGDYYLYCIRPPTGIATSLRLGQGTLGRLV